MSRWRKQLAVLFLATAMMLGGAFELRAVAPNNIITYQGRVLSTNGVPVSDASLSMKFFLYSDLTGGTCVWSNSSHDCNGNNPVVTTARTVTLTSGLFTQNLGDTIDASPFAQITDSVFGSDASLYLEVIIGSETLSPRRKITAAPYAVNSQLLDGLDSADFNLDRVYDNDSDSTLAVDGASGLTFTNSGTANVTFNLSSTGDFAVQDNGVTAVAITDGGVLDVDGGVELGDGGDAIAISSSDWGITTAGVMTGVSGLTSDGLVTGTLGATFSGATVSLNASSNFGANINTGTSTGTVSIGNSAATVGITSNTLSLTDDNWGITSTGGATFATLSATSVSSNLDLSNNLLLNIGNAGTDFTSGGGLTLAGDLTITGDDLVMGTNTSGAILVADGTNFNPVVLGGDATVSTAGSLTISGNSVALSTDTTGNYIATLADSGNSTVTITNGSTEGGAATINVIDVNCTDCLGTTEIADSYLLNTGDTSTGDLVLYNDGVGGLGNSPNLTLTPLAGTSWNLYVENTADDLQIVANTASTETLDITNIGAGVLDVTIEGDLTITGDDLVMGTNTSGAILVADGTNFNPVVLGGDATVSTAGSLTISGNSVALSTDTTGNYIATLADSGDGDFTIAGSGSEGATVTIDLANDVLDFAEFEDSLELDAATDINLGANLFSIDLDSTGDFVVQDNGTAFWTFTDDRSIDYSTNQTTTDALDFTADSLTTAQAIDLSVDALTTGKGLNISSTSSTLTSGRLVDVDHTATYTSDETLSGYGLRVNRDITMNGGGALMTNNSDLALFSSSATVAVGALIDSSNILHLQQNYASATGDVLRALNAGTGRGIFIDQNGNGTALSIDAESTTANVATIDGATTTSGKIVDIIGGDFTNDTGLALSIDVTEPTETADIVNIQTNFTSNNNNVFRIEADGETFSDVGFTAGAFSTNYYDGSVTTSGTMTIDSSGTVQLGTDDDLLPQLGASDADIGATGTRWDNVFSVAGNFSGTVTVGDITCTDCLDFTELSDTLALDTSTSIAMDAAETFTITNGGSGNAVINLSSTGDFVVQDNGTAFWTFTDDRSIDYSTNQTTTDALDFTADSLTTGQAIDLSIDALTMGKGLNISSTSPSITSGRLVDIDHTATYTSPETLSGYGLRVNRDITMNSPGGVLTNNGDVVLFSNTAAVTSGTIVDTSNVLHLQQNYASATGDVLRALNAGTGRGIFVDQNGNGAALSIDAESTTANVATIDGATTTSGKIVDIIGGDFTNDTGLALSIDVTESTETADIVNIQTNFSSSNNNVFRIEADGEAFSDIGFTAGTFSTNYYDGSITSSGTMTIDSSGIVQLGTDDDFLPQLGASDADIGATGTRWDNVFSVAGNFSGTVAVSDLTCTDCLDFAEFEDVLDIDTATDINLGTNLFSIDLDSTGDFAVRDGTTNLVLFEDDSTVDVTFPATGFLTIDASSTANTTTTGVIDLNVAAGDAAVDGINVLLTQNSGASTGVDATALEMLLTGNDADGDMFGLTITGAATANAGAGTYESLITLTNNENTIGAVTDAIRITSGAATSGSITTGLDFDTTDITTDIEFQNGDTLDNNTDGQFLFSRDTDADVTIMAADSSGAANLTIDTTGAGAITIGSADVASLSLITDNNNAADVGITGGLTVTSGATHNSFTLTSSADTERAALITADSITSGYGIDLSVDALTTGTGFNVSSESSALTSGSLGTFRHDGAYVTSTPSTVTLSGRALTVGQNPALNGTGTLEVTGNAMKVMRTIENFSTGTITETGALLDVARAQANSGGGTFTVTGPVLSISSDNDISVTDSANVVSITQNNGGATGTVAQIRNFGVGSGMHLTQDTINTPSANGTDRQALILDVNEANIGGVTTDAVFLIRSDADGTPDTEFRIEGDGDYMYDGTGSSPASDLAEVYPSSQALKPGDLVVLDSSGNLSVSKTSETYQPNLFGAVSTKPAVRMGAETVGYDIALIGRIPVKVSGENGSIQVGDPLTSSSTIGHAMKASEAGMIVGYALESFSDSGTGIINAFINVGWFAGNIISNDGTSTIATDNVVIAQIANATAQTPTFDSYGLSLRGSAWNGGEAEAVEMILKNVVVSDSEYRLSVRNAAQSEVAYVTNEGTMRIVGDMVIGGNFYPSDRGVPQIEKYIYYDGSEGPAGDFMRTNAKGWSTGSYDFAEMFPSEEKLMAGELVVFSGESVARATGQKGEQLVGVVSTRPGFLAGENVAGSYPIALAGRVPTRASAQNGAIKVGDPLVVGSVEGTAVKATDAGQVVGYALESFDGTESDNLILAYVNVGYWAGDALAYSPPVDNRASEISTQSTTNFTALDMSGDIFMGSHQILGIGKLEGIGSLWSLETDGTFKTEGLMKTVIASYQNEKVETIAVTSPEAVITLSGTSKLEDGIVEVRFEDIDPTFNDVISAVAPVRVFVTPAGPVSLYVSEKDQNHFIVTRFQGEADVEFDWMAVGYRKGYEPEEESEEVIEGDEGDKVVEAEEVEGDSEQEDTQDVEVEEEAANPESPDENLIDPTTQGDGDGDVEEPPEVVEDQVIDSLPE